jgi:hypothetical protein
MNVNKLLKKVELFEKLATFGNRQAFLEAIAQQALDPETSYEQFKAEKGAVGPLSEEVENELRAEFEALVDKTKPTYVPSAKPVVEKPNFAAKSKAVDNVLAVMNKYMTEVDYVKNKDLQAGVDKAWQSLPIDKPVATGNMWTDLQNVAQEIKKYTEHDAGSMNPEQKVFDKKYLDLLALRKKDLMSRLNLG